MFPKHAVSSVVGIGGLAGSLGGVIFPYIIGVIFGMVSTFFAGYLPSRRAEKMDPVDVIRGQ
jgi:ABC-type antimicrobial peptide transport system permease subunit